MQGLALTPSTEERLAILETKMEALLDRLEKQNAQLEELLLTFERAKGAKWLLVGVFGLAVFLGGKATLITAWLFDGK